MTPACNFSEDGVPVDAVCAAVNADFGVGVGLRAGLGEVVAVRFSTGLEAGDTGRGFAGFTILPGEPNGESCEFSVCRVSSTCRDEAGWACASAHSQIRSIMAQPELASAGGILKTDFVPPI